MYQIDKGKFKEAFENLKIQKSTTQIGLLRLFGYESNNVYYTASSKGLASEEFLKILRYYGANVSEFMKREDFINLFGNE